MAFSNNQPHYRYSNKNNNGHVDKPFNNVPSALQNHLESVSQARTTLHKVSDTFDATRDVHPLHCDEAVATIRLLNNSVNNICTLLNRSASVRSAVQSNHYNVLASLYYFDEMAEQLSTLIGNFKYFCLEQTKDSSKQQQEIERRFAQLLKISSDLEPQCSALFER